LVLAAVILLPFDIAVRRLVITRADAQKLVMRVRALVAPAQPVVAGASRVGSLLDVKERAAEQRKSATPAARATVARLRQSKTEAPSEPHPALRPEPTPTSTQVSTRTQVPAPKPAPPSPPPARPASGASTASSLLKSKRQRRGEDE
jgi:hypothetical protein